MYVDGNISAAHEPVAEGERSAEVGRARKGEEEGVVTTGAAHCLQW